MGPLGGIAAALHHALDEGYEAVLTIGVDSPDLPEELPNLLSPSPAYLAAQPVVGLWHASSAAIIEAILEGTGRHSMLAFTEALGARSITLPTTPANINSPADLATLEQRHGL